MTVAREIAKFALGLDYDALPVDVVHEAKKVVLDALGCAIGAYPSETSRVIQNIIKELGGPKESTVIGSGLRTSCLNALLANGVMVRYLDFNDGYLILVGSQTTGSHPSDMIPTVLALGEREHSKGRDVINAIVLAYELSARFMHAFVNPASVTPTIEAKGWNCDTRGIFVMPVVAGKLLGLNEEQMEHAIGISGSHNMVLGILDATGEEYTMTKNLRTTLTAYGGVMAALMAQKGFTGPSRVLEGNKGFIQTVMGGEFNVGRLTEVGEKFKILDTAYKPFPADGTTHGHVTATLELVKENDIKPEDVVAVKIMAPSRCTEHTGDPAKRFPANKESADHSSYYLTAIAIVDRRIGPDQYSEKKFKDPRVRDLIEKVSIEADPSLDRTGQGGISEIRIKQGGTFKKRVEYPKGHLMNRMTDQDLEEKFHGMAEKFMTERRIKEVIATIYELEKLNDIGELMRKVVFRS
jgi:2-methylcitrate dehydratase